MGITWEEAEVTAQNRSEWRQSVARVDDCKCQRPWQLGFTRFLKKQNMPVRLSLCLTLSVRLCLCPVSEDAL